MKCKKVSLNTRLQIYIREINGILDFRVRKYDDNITDLSTTLGFCILWDFILWNDKSA